MRRKIKLCRGDTLGGTVPLILPGRLCVAPGRSRFGNSRRKSGGWRWKLFWSVVVIVALGLGVHYGLDYTGTVSNG